LPPDRFGPGRSAFLAQKREAVGMRAAVGAFLAFTLVILTTVSARALNSAQPITSDVELFEVLDSAGLVDAWNEASLTRPEFNFVPVQSDAYDLERETLIELIRLQQGTEADWAAVAARQQRALQEQDQLQMANDENDLLLREIAKRTAAIEAELDRLRLEIPEIEGTLIEIAVARYMGGRLNTGLQTLQGVSEPVKDEATAAAVLFATEDAYITLRRSTYDRIATLERELEVFALERATALDRVAGINQQQIVAQQQFTAVDARMAGLAINGETILEQLEVLIPQVHQARAQAMVPDGDGMSLLALDAYIAGAESMTDLAAECVISWEILAAIGEIESKHGTLGNRWIAPNGNLSSGLLGPLLDGSAFALVKDSDNGSYDGSHEFDRALGPMQFLPSTWLRHGVDGNADGFNDPQNIYDAAAGAANYLCELGKERKTANIEVRLRGYNDSTSYIIKVMDTADRYRNQGLPGAPVIEIPAD